MCSSEIAFFSCCEIMFGGALISGAFTLSYSALTHEAEKYIVAVGVRRVQLYTNMTTLNYLWGT